VIYKKSLGEVAMVQALFLQFLAWFVMACFSAATAAPECTFPPQDVVVKQSGSSQFKSLYAFACTPELQDIQKAWKDSFSGTYRTITGSYNAERHLTRHSKRVHAARTAS